MKEYCVCGHLKDSHLYSDFGYFMCYRCYGEGIPIKVRRHGFKLDNLKLVEDLAKERNLL